ncbi:hypothetical protein CCR75_002269 [Bremia lactucae]|uniref:Ubiquitin carboxyl-terminal hydrolase n=1 Tax=Bremia lactucae TaxID=4779 RepID=A0A976FMR8_BRELC|nr:hypothetical protein CCR75_002269 [Bremia lactucae]
MTVPGLQNLGNTCFFNAILQALASLSSVHEYLEDIVQSERAGKCDIAFTSTLLDCLDALAPRESSSVVAPRVLNAELTHQLSYFRGNKQQDAQELLQFIFKLVSGEQRRCIVQDRGLLDLISDNVSISSSISELRLSQAVNERSWNPFQGLQVNVLQCTRCNCFRPLMNQPFLDVSLSLVTPGGKNVSRLIDALQLYTANEVIKDVDCSICSVKHELKAAKEEYTQALEEIKACNTNGAVSTNRREHDDWIDTLEHFANFSTNFDLQELPRPIPRSQGDCIKRLLFSRSPDVLCFHLNRKMYMKRGGAIKLETFIEFPLELDMKEFCQFEINGNDDQCSSSKSEWAFKQQSQASMFLSFSETLKQHSLLYVLTAVILHHGNERSGHFTAYRRVSNLQWSFVSDDTVREVPVAEVLKSCAYMLFYERKSRTQQIARSSETEEMTDDDDDDHLLDFPFGPDFML